MHFWIISNLAKTGGFAIQSQVLYRNIADQVTYRNSDDMWPFLIFRHFWKSRNIEILQMFQIHISKFQIWQLLFLAERFQKGGILKLRLVESRKIFFQSIRNIFTKRRPEKFFCWNFFNDLKGYKNIKDKINTYFCGVRTCPDF